MKIKSMAFNCNVNSHTKIPSIQKAASTELWDAPFMCWLFIKWHFHRVLKQWHKAATTTATTVAAIDNKIRNEHDGSSEYFEKFLSTDIMVSSFSDSIKCALFLVGHNVFCVPCAYENEKHWEWVTKKNSNVEKVGDRERKKVLVRHHHNAQLRRMKQ